MKLNELMHWAYVAKTDRAMKPEFLEDVAAFTGFGFTE